MVDSKKNKNDRTESIKSTLLEFLKKSVGAKEKKGAFAKFAGLSQGGVNSFLYQGKGSFETWVNALLFHFDLKPEKITEHLEALFHSFQADLAESKSDKQWRKIAEKLSEEDRLYYLTIISMLVEMANLKKLKAKSQEKTPSHQKHTEKN
jgi:hypothetical protein